jgi:hypothetical protein
MAEGRRYADRKIALESRSNASRIKLQALRKISNLEIFDLPAKRS